MESHELVLLFAYGSLVFELVVLPIPSEASTYQLFLRAPPRDPEQDRLSRARLRRRRWKVVRYFLPTSLGIALFLIPLVLLWLPDWHAALWPIRAMETTSISAAGMALVLLGRAVTFGATLQLRRAKRRSAGLAAHGFFRHSRNPGLVGMYLFYLGCVLIYPSWLLLGGFLPYALNMHRRVLMEESHLSCSLGATYATYRGRVPRYLPLGPLR